MVFSKKCLEGTNFLSFPQNKNVVSEPRTFPGIGTQIPPLAQVHEVMGVYGLSSKDLSSGSW